MSGDVAPPAGPLQDQFPLESFEDLPDDALCVICQMPSLDNVSLCLKGHNACRACADRLVASYHESSDKCASCREPLHRPIPVAGQGAKWMANTALNNLVKDFQIKCPNVKGGCTHTCKATEMREHAAKCEYREIACKCTSCPWKGPACKWHDHMQQEDHGRYLVDMMLFTQQVCVTLTEKSEANEALGEKFRTEVFEPMKTQMSCIGTGVNQVQSALTALENKAKWNDGSSVRSKSRDRKNQKDVDTAQEKQAEAEAERDTLKRKLAESEASDRGLTEWERGRYAAMEKDLRDLPSVQQWKDTCDARDRFFRERDEARHESHSAQQRIHDQHQVLKKMMPQATGPCPCTLTTCGAGGGFGNHHLYKRRNARRTVDEDSD